jgi:hypothetical protein
VPVKGQKLSVTLPESELAWARERAARDGTTLSEVLAEAVRASRAAEEHRADQRAAWAEFLWWATEGRGITDEEIDEAGRELGGTAPPVPPRRSR